MSLFRDCRTAVKLLWTTHWPAPSGVSVYWHEGVENIVPDDPADTPIWLHLAVEFDAPLVADPTDPDPARLVPTTVDDDDVFRLLAGCELNGDDWC